jgi:hypothetical protein
MMVVTATASPVVVLDVFMFFAFAPRLHSGLSSTTIVISCIIVRITEVPLLLILFFRGGIRVRVARIMILILVLLLLLTVIDILVLILRLTLRSTT